MVKKTAVIFFLLLMLPIAFSAEPGGFFIIMDTIEHGKILSPIVSGAANMVADQIKQNDKIVYILDLINKEAPERPVFDLATNSTMEFRLNENKIVMDNDEIVDYEKLMNNTETFPIVRTELRSNVNYRIYETNITLGASSAVMDFISDGKEVAIDIQEFKIEDRKLSLIENNMTYEVGILPQELYPAISDNDIGSIKLEVENGKAVYKLSMKEDFKLFWIIPMKINSEYTLDSNDGSTLKIDKPWFTFFGQHSVFNLRLIE